MKLLKSLGIFLSRAASAMGSVAASAIVWLVAFGVCGFASIVAGVGVLYGVGPALVAAGISFLSMAAFIKQGMTHG